MGAFLGYTGEASRECVERGAERMDLCDPDWYVEGEVDFHDLEMWNGNMCMLGQRFTTYALGLEALGLTRAEAAAHGFIGPGMVNGTLAELWEEQAEIRRLRDALAVAEENNALATA